MRDFLTDERIGVTLYRRRSSRVRVRGNFDQRENYETRLGTSCMGAYYVLNTYNVLYFTYNTLHTYRAKQD